MAWPARRAEYQLVLPAAAARVSEMCMWSRWRNVPEQRLILRQPPLR
ncbi:MAG TPA: hypothetical protein VF012_00790 [Nocardioidaceae bacterium]